MAEKILIKKRDYDTAKEIVNSEYSADDVIYPARIAKWINSKNIYAYNILLSLEKENLVKKIYQVKCPYCENEKPRNYSKIADIPKMLICNVCGKEYAALDECTVAFSKTCVVPSHERSKEVS